MKHNFLLTLTIGSLLAGLLGGKTDVSAAMMMPVPFTLQSPYGNWNQPWQDACEEATILMIDYFYTGKKIANIPKTEAANRILEIVKLENNYFGFNKDTNAQQMVELINNFFPWEAYVVNEPSLAQIKAEIDNARPVIALVYGKALQNPYFKNNGPDYHTVVIKGYDDENGEFIVNDPGIGKGLDYHYPYDRLMDALHDFLPDNKTREGQKVALFTRQEIIDSRDEDGDQDGLVKAEEAKYGTDITKKDTDNDGFTDGMEVAGGYLPTLAEKKLPHGTLIKSSSSPQVYKLSYHRKRYIVSEHIFRKHKWKWKNIVIVSDAFLASLKNGKDIKK